MVSKKFKQDFLKIQRALKDNLQKNPEKLLSNLGMKKTYHSVKIRKRLLTALLRIARQVLLNKTLQKTV